MFCCSKPVWGSIVRQRRSYATRDLRTGRRCAPLLLAALLTTYAVCAAAQGDGDGSGSATRVSLSLTSERVANLDGGIAQGAASDNLLLAGISINGGAVGLPVASQLYASFIHTWNDRPSANLVGDIQGFSNISAAPRSSLYTLWYRQQLAGSHWSAALGLVPADQYFDVADSAGLLNNSSFGVQPTWSVNTVAPVYPTAGLGAIVTWDNGPWRNRAGLFQADPGDRGTALGRGFLLVDEVNFSPSVAAIYKFGLWSYHPHAPPSVSLPQATWGGYAIAERALNDRGTDATVGFVRVGWSPPQAGTIALDFQVGVLVPAPFAARPDDRFSVGIASAQLRGGDAETAYEITYLLALTGHLSLQPDLQYIAKPGGTYPAATVATLRLHIDL